MELLPVDHQLAGRYLIARVLGTGGMGAVYLARDVRLPDREWAVKEVFNQLPDCERRERANRLFEKEAELLSKLDHPNIPRIVDYFSDGGREYLVMEYVNGTTLEDMLSARRTPIEERAAIDYALQICRVLSYLHGWADSPIVFRDVKPSNIMVTEQQAVKLIDFGIARFFAPEKVTDTLALGTVGYAPPEQFGGKGGTDPRADIYALGATMHHMLTLRNPQDHPPFSFPPVRALNPEISPAMERIVTKALSYDRESRYLSVDEVTRDLERLRRGELSCAEPVPARPCAPVPFRVKALWALLLLLMGGSLYLGVAMRGPNAAPETAAPPQVQSSEAPEPAVTNHRVAVDGLVLHLSSNPPAMRMTGDLEFEAGLTRPPRTKAVSAHRGLVRFDLATLPTETPPEEAILLSDFDCLKGEKAEQMLRIYRVIRPWDEKSVPADMEKSGAVWGVPDVDYDPEPLANYDGTPPVVGGRANILWHIESTVRKWMAGELPNYGVICISKREKEAAAPDSTVYFRRPKLFLMFRKEQGAPIHGYEVSVREPSGR